VRNSDTNGLLGYAGDARLLIVNADDFGMSKSVNEGVLRAIKEGVARSASLMVPWPEAAQAMRMLRENPEVHVGIHLSVICDIRLPVRAVGSR
jgi:chitin disaccharide deacetylase